MESGSLPGGFGHPAAMTKYFSRADQNSGKEPAQIKSESAFQQPGGGSQSPSMRQVFGSKVHNPVRIIPPPT